MIAEGRVFPERVDYNALPWKYAAGTPNILGTIVSAQALRLLLDLAMTPNHLTYFGTAKPIERRTIQDAMTRVSAWNQPLAGRVLDGLGAIGGITIYGPRDPARRTSLVAFNLAGHDPVSVAERLNQAGVESRAGCHCATLAHRALRLNPPASCRLSFYLYNTPTRSTRPWLPWRASPPADERRPGPPSRLAAACPRHPGTGAAGQEDQGRAGRSRWHRHDGPGCRRRAAEAQAQPRAHPIAAVVTMATAYHLCASRGSRAGRR
jgi:hypothetical protein